MKIRSQIELQDFLDGNLAKRKRELTSYKFVVAGARKHERGPLLRAAIPLIYAHWEGFIKYASIAYLDYISRNRPVLKNLKPNLAAVAIRDKLMSSLNSKKVVVHEELIRFITDNLDRNISFDPSAAIDTESNLSSIVLKDIMHTVGLNFDETWEKKIHQIDGKLLKHRNEISHGELVEVSETEYDDLHNFVLNTLEHYKALIEIAAQKSEYQRSG